MVLTYFDYSKIKRFKLIPNNHDIDLSNPINVKLFNNLKRIKIHGPKAIEKINNILNIYNNSYTLMYPKTQMDPFKTRINEIPDWLNYYFIVFVLFFDVVVY